MIRSRVNRSQVIRARVWFLAAVSGWLVGGPWIGAASARDVQVNTYTTDLQRLPDLAMDADGNFVVVWESAGSYGSDTSESSIQGQRFTRDGSAAGGEFQVNTYTTGVQRGQSVAMDADGDFVVVWMSKGSFGSDDSDYSIQGQRYAADGIALGRQFQVNTYTTDRQSLPAVGGLANGDFIVVWDSLGSFGTDTLAQSVQAQRYASSGEAIGGEFQVNSYTTSSQYSADLGFHPNGDFIIAWGSFGSYGSDTSFASVQAQRYAADGLLVGGQFQVNTNIQSSQSHPGVAVKAGGDFVVVWEGADADYSSVQGQLYAANGSAIGAEFRVNTYTTSVQFHPEVALDEEGGFVVVWSSYGSYGEDTFGTSVQGRRYTATGAPVDNQFQINTGYAGEQTFPAVALDPDGDAVVVWGSTSSDGTDPVGGSIQKTSPKQVFADGFESGDTSAWSDDR